VQPADDRFDIGLRRLDSFARPRAHFCYAICVFEGQLCPPLLDAHPLGYPRQLSTEILGVRQAAFGCRCLQPIIDGRIQISHLHCYSHGSILRVLHADIADSHATLMNQSSQGGETSDVIGHILWRKAMIRALGRSVTRERQPRASAASVTRAV
jgi:hypothetical protein